MRGPTPSAVCLVSCGLRAPDHRRAHRPGYPVIEPHGLCAHGPCPTSPPAACLGHRTGSPSGDAGAPRQALRCQQSRPASGSIRLVPVGLSCRTPCDRPCGPQGMRYPRLLLDPRTGSHAVPSPPCPWARRAGQAGRVGQRVPAGQRRAAGPGCQPCLLRPVALAVRPALALKPAAQPLQPAGPSHGQQR
jgi:hypothetical protein